MAKGDMKANLNASVGNGSFLDIRPPSGEEWDIHNIFHSGSIELYWADGTQANDLLFDESSGKGAYNYFIFEVKYEFFIRVKNVSGDTAKIGYSGKQVAP